MLVPLFAGTGLVALLIKVALLPGFVALLYLMRFFEPGEWAAALRLVQRIPGADEDSRLRTTGPSAS